MIDTTQSKAGFAIEGQHFEAPPAVPGLHIVATPIGNLADITIRALHVLAATDLIYCEDTRITSRLLSRYQIATPLKPYHDHNGAKIRPHIISALTAGKSIALVSDAGTPLISDPGFKLVHELRSLGLPVHMAPGVSAPPMALALSGFPSDLFQFAGFLPPKQGARCKVLQNAMQYRGVSIFFESPNRLMKTLADIHAIASTAKLCVARELTKKFEEVINGTAHALMQEFSKRSGVKGEITLLIWPGEPQVPKADDAEVLQALGDALRNQSAAKAAQRVAGKFGLKKSQLYDAAVKIKNQMDD